MFDYIMKYSQFGKKNVVTTKYVLNNLFPSTIYKYSFAVVPMK